MQDSRARAVLPSQLFYKYGTVSIFPSFSSHSLSPYTLPEIWRQRRIGSWSKGAPIVGRMWEVGTHKVKESGLGSSRPQMVALKMCLRGGHSGRNRAGFVTGVDVLLCACPPCYSPPRQRQSWHQASSHCLSLFGLTSRPLASVPPSILLGPQALHRAWPGSAG